MTLKIRVPEEVGEEVTVTVGRPGAEPVSYPVKDGVVEVPEEDAETFLRSVPGAEVDDGTRRDSSEQRERERDTKERQQATAERERAAETRTEGHVVDATPGQTRTTGAEPGAEASSKRSSAHKGGTEK